MSIRSPIARPIAAPIDSPLGGTGFSWEASGGGAPYDPATVEAAPLVDMWATYNTTVTGSGVSSWKNRLNTAHDFVQAVDAARPPLLASWSNGNPAVDFQGNDTLRYDFASDGLLASGQSVTAYLFYELDALHGAGVGSTAIDFDAGRLWLQPETFDAGTAGWFEAAYRNTVAPSTGKHLLTWALAAGGTGTVYQDGVSLGTAAFTGLGLGGATNIGAIATGGLAFLDAKIGRLLVFGALHDASARTRVRAWGQSYYGMP